MVTTALCSIRKKSSPDEMLWFSIQLLTENANNHNGETYVGDRLYKFHLLLIILFWSAFTIPFQICSLPLLQTPTAILCPVVILHMHLMIIHAVLFLVLFMRFLFLLYPFSCQFVYALCSA